MAPKENDDISELHCCQICRVRVTSSAAEHEASPRHRAAARLAAAALARLRAQLAPRGAPRPAHTGELEQPGGDATHPPDTPNPVVQFCGSCAAPCASTGRAAHRRSRGHLEAALQERVLDELVREYVDEEDLVFLEPSKSGEERGLSATASDVIKKYTCHMCAIKVPEIYRDEHEDSPRHRSCVALAHAAARRTEAFLLRTSTDLPLTENDNITALLNAYIGVESAPDEGKKTEENVPKTVKKRLTSKEYFTSIVPFLQYVGTFCTVIIDDTEYVTIRTASDTLRVHVVNFNGLYSGQESELKCKLCHGVQDVSYSSLGDRDKMHVMTLGHIKEVLKPIDNVHGIRKLNENSAICVLCNVYLSTYYVKEHVMKDIQHTAMLTEALERGKAFKESENDLKLVMFSPGERDNTPYNPPGFGYVHHQQGLNFGQHDQSYTSPRYNPLFGSTPPKQTRQNDFPRNGTFGTASTQNTGNSTTFGLASTQNTGNSTTFGLASTQNTGNSAAFGLASTQNTGNSAAFGLASTQNTGNSAAFTGFGQPNQNTSGSFAFGGFNTAHVQTNQPSAGLFSVKSNQTSFPQNSSSFGIATTQQMGSSQNQSNSSQQSCAFGASNQPAGFGVANQSDSLPDNSSPLQSLQTNKINF